MSYHTADISVYLLMVQFSAASQSLVDVQWLQSRDTFVAGMSLENGCRQVYNYENFAPITIVCMWRSSMDDHIDIYLCYTAVSADESETSADSVRADDVMSPGRQYLLTESVCFKAAADASKKGR